MSGSRTTRAAMLNLVGRDVDAAFKLLAAVWQRPRPDIFADSGHRI